MKPAGVPGLALALACALMGGTRERSDGHGVLKVSWGTAETPRALQPKHVSLVTRPRILLCQQRHCRLMASKTPLPAAAAQPAPGAEGTLGAALPAGSHTGGRAKQRPASH